MEGCRPSVCQGRSMVDSIVLVALALFGSAALALSPIPTALAAAAITAVLRTRASRPGIVIALGALFLGGLRARAAIEGAAILHRRAVELLPAPSRCEGQGRILSSPVMMRGQARVEVEIEAGTCGDRAITTPFRARLYGAPEQLGRGDRVAIVADLAPVHLFLNEGSTDPRPSIARSGIAISGGAIEVQVLERSRSLGALLDGARIHVRR